MDTNHEIFSSEPTIVIDDPDEDFTLPMFIAMDPPQHDEQRKVVSPVVGPETWQRWSRSSVSGFATFWTRCR